MKELNSADSWIFCTRREASRLIKHQEPAHVRQVQSLCENHHRIADTLKLSSMLKKRKREMVCVMAHEDEIRMIECGLMPRATGKVGARMPEKMTKWILSNVLANES